METHSAEKEEEKPAEQMPQWVARSLTFAEGRDPLGFQTTTQDRLMPVLFPGILELTRRARYFSFHAFLLDEYRKRRLPADVKVLSDYIKRCEWDFGLAVQRCPNHCGSSPVGARLLGNLASRQGPFPRGESVESTLGGYGLYYRSPMSTLGIVAKSGTLLGDRPTPIDLLYPSDRAIRLSEGFRSAVCDTAYYHRWMWTMEDLPTDVVDEYAKVACFCRLPNCPNERDAVHDALFSTGPADSHPGDHPEVEIGNNGVVIEVPLRSETMQRRLSVGHYLTLVDTYPDIVGSGSVFRQKMCDPPNAGNQKQQIVAGQWAGLIAKDVWQEAVCSVWSDFCRTGIKKTRELGRGLTWEETKQVAMNMVAGPPELTSEQSTKELINAIAKGDLNIENPDGKLINIAVASLESLRQLTERLDNGASGLVTALALAHRIESRSDEGWLQTSKIGSSWQPSLSLMLKGLSVHLDRAPSVGESLWWMVSNFILGVHERISYSKLPEFTFRFRWEDGLLRFYDNGIGRFPLAAIRRETLAMLTKDLGLWQTVSSTDNRGVLTERGKVFVAEVFG